MFDYYEERSTELRCFLNSKLTEPVEGPATMSYKLRMRAREMCECERVNRDIYGSRGWVYIYLAG